MTMRVPGQQWIRDVNVDDFDSLVLAALQQYPVLVDFWAEWCSPCLVIAPVLTRVVEGYAGALEQHGGM